MFYFLLVVIVVILLYSIRQVNQYERGVKFMLGKFIGVRNPGWRIILPIIQSMRKVDIRTKVIDVPEQDAITQDNISLRVSAVLYFKVIDAGKAILDVEDYRYAISQLALTTMRNAVGEVTLDELLSQRDKISDNIAKVVAQSADCWGIHVENVELKEITLPEDMKRVIARQAEAERERRAVITKAAGEVEASQNLAKAASIMSSAPGALHIRTLTTLTDVSADKSNTIIVALPVEMIDSFKAGNAGKVAKQFMDKK